MTGGAIMIAKQKEKNVYLELADKPLLHKEFCTYLGIGQTKARELIRSKRLHVFFKDRK